MRGTTLKKKKKAHGRQEGAEKMTGIERRALERPGPRVPDGGPEERREAGRALRAQTLLLWEADGV